MISLHVWPRIEYFHVQHYLNVFLSFIFTLIPSYHIKNQSEPKWCKHKNNKNITPFKVLHDAAVIISCYIWQSVHNVVSSLWLLRKLQLWASYCNSNPSGTYILTDAWECTFQLSFLEAHISLVWLLLQRPQPLYPGRWCNWETVEGDCHVNSCCSENRSICNVITVSVGGGQEGVVAWML